MNKLIRMSVSVLVFIFLVFSGYAQKTKTKIKTSDATDTATNAPKTKTEQMMADAGNYTKMADDVKVKVKGLFPTKAGDTVYFVIPGITYADPNLKLFKQKLDNIKSTKGLTSSYRNNTAVVKILFKGGDASRLYDNLDDEIKALFMPEDMEGNRAILNYKLANQTETTTDKKTMAATRSN